MVNKKHHPKTKVKKKAARKRLSKRASDHEVPVKLLVQHLNCPISMFDFRKRKFIYANKHFTLLTGITSEECCRMSIEDFLKHVQSNDLLLLQNEMKIELIAACNQ